MANGVVETRDSFEDENRRRQGQELGWCDRNGGSEAGQQRVLLKLCD
jgi:hypothetical protein